MSLLFVLSGILFGSLNGILSRFALKQAMPQKNPIFLMIWLVGAAYRLSAVVLSVILLKNNGLSVVLSFVLSLIAAQEFFLLLPIKTGETRKNF